MKKELEIINRAVVALVKYIDEEYDARMGVDFGACMDENVVEWSLLVPEGSGKEFYENFCTRFPVARGFDLFTLSILHEVGHLETEWEMIDDTKIRNRKGLTNAEYFNLFNERIATDWAGEWIENNIKLALDIDKIFKKMLKKFYEATLSCFTSR